jgi:ABC-type lipoprotein release transport system permease subunit
VPGLDLKERAVEMLAVALRNVERNRRRSALTIVTLVIGTSILVNAQGLLRGFTSTVYGRMMDMDTAQVQVEAVAYRADARRLPLDLVVERPGELVARLRSVSGVAAVSQRIDAAFEITNGVEGLRVMVRGVDAEELRVTALARAIVAGAFPENGRPGLVIGSGLAAKLGLKAGDSAFFTALDSRPVRNLGAAPIAAIFSFGYPLMDDLCVYLDIDQARAFLSLGDEATRLVLRAAPGTDAADLTRRVGKELESARPDGKLRAYEWKTFAENLVSTVDTRLRLLGTVLLLLFLLIGAGVFNTMAMSVQERYREIGALRAMGMRRSTLGRLFLGVGVGWCGGFAGGATAGGPATGFGLFLGLSGLDVSKLLPRDIPIPFGTRLLASYLPIDALRAFSATLSAAVLGSLVPARRAARLAITDALGNVL